MYEYYKCPKIKTCPPLKPRVTYKPIAITDKPKNNNNTNENNDNTNSTCKLIDGICKCSNGDYTGDFMDSDDNCGKCGNKCKEKEFCLYGTCTEPIYNEYYMKLLKDNPDFYCTKGFYPILEPCKKCLLRDINYNTFRCKECPLGYKLDDQTPTCAPGEFCPKKLIKCGENKNCSGCVEMFK